MTTVDALNDDPRRIDILTSISGVEFEAAWRTREHSSWRGRDVAFLGRDALIANKRASGRAKDLEDLRRLQGGTP